MIITRNDCIKIVRIINNSELDDSVVMGIIAAESSFDLNAVRYEPRYKYLFGDNLSDTEATTQKISWGLMQIMGAVAREIGFDGWLTELLNPYINIGIGIEHLKRLNNRWSLNWEVSGLISSYNQGGPYTASDGKYKNYEYVEKVIKYIGDFQ